MAAKKRKADDWAKRTYKATDSTACVHALQELMNDQSGKFEWSSHLDSKEISFIYDIVSKANSFSDFVPTAAQSRWMVGLLGKLKLIKNETSKGKKKNSQKKNAKV